MNKIFHDINYLGFRPRVRLTAYCNRRCGYCFAKDYLNARGVPDEIDINDMEIILRSCREEKIPCIGWQGGEPTLHTNIDSIIKLHEKYGIKAMVFTNGLIRREVIEHMTGIVEAVLVNCNEPDTYQDGELSELFSNIEMMKKLYGEEKTAIGINIYSEKMDTSFILDYALRTGIKEVRIDITRPAPSNGNVYVDFNNIKKVFDKAKSTHSLLRKNGVKYVHFDCPFPLCAITDADAAYLRDNMVDDFSYGQCSTALDITTGFNIAACFCSIPFHGINVSRFDSLTHAWLFIKYLEDEVKWSVYTKEACAGCFRNKRKICQGGCLGYKPGIHEVFDEERLMNECGLFNKTRDIAKLYILYKNHNYSECYQLAARYSHEKKDTYPDAVKEIQLLSAIHLKKDCFSEHEIMEMITKSPYTSSETLLFASALYDGYLDLAIEVAERALRSDHSDSTYRLHYFLYKAYKQRGMREKSSIHFIHYYKGLPDIKKPVKKV